MPWLFSHLDEIKRIQWMDWIKLALSGAALGLHFVLWVGSLRYTNVASSTALLTLEAIFVMIGCYWIFGQKANRIAIASMATAICWAVWIGWGDFRFSGTALLGDLLSILGALTVAGHMLLGKRLRAYTSAFVYSFIVFIFAGFVLVL